MDTPPICDLRAAVLDRPDLQLRLMAHAEPDRFGADVAVLAAELGVPVTEADVQVALGEAHGEWMHRCV
jgi:hypothetical protein